jgi:formate dehydrogenase major subunit
MALVTAKIDGQDVMVEAGTTILDAARKLGIEIPTLCSVEGLEPVASCFLCAVQIEGRLNLSPACAMPVSDSMVVTTNSADIRAARKMALELLLSDHAGDCIAPCSARCPAGLDIPGFVYQIAVGLKRRAMEVISDRLTFPGALGRVCPRLCEADCRRCGHDEGLSIGALHRFAADQDLASADHFAPSQTEATGRKVAIVGAGPAGLTAAYYLLLKGHACTLFDAHPLPGGMLRYGIPAYRLPKNVLDAEIEAVVRLGAELRMNSAWGKDFSLADLRSGFDAVFLAIGAQKTQGLRCEGDQLAMSGIEFLARVANGERPSLGDRVTVVGGGNTAMDACRTAVRLGTGNVQVLYRRTRQEMPCLMEEVEGAEAEGVHIEYLATPSRIDRESDGALRITCLRMELGEPDSSGRRRPVPLPGSEFTIRADTVIAAIGQAVDCSHAADEGLKTTSWGIAVDARTLMTSLPGIFAGGDAVCGPDLAVRAVAAGRLAAVSIHQHLSGQPVTGEPAMINVSMKAPTEDELAALFRRVERAPRIRAGQIGAAQRRTSFDEIEATLMPAQAAAEARRCLTCGCRKADECRVRQYATEYQANPYRFAGERRRFAQDLTHPEIVYEPGKCIMCDACVRIAAQMGEPLGVAIVGRGFKVSMAVPFDGTLAQGLRAAAEQCAKACPTGALALRTERSCDLGTCHGPQFVQISR